MGRKHRRRSEDPRPIRDGGSGVRESYPDGDWFVRRITGSSSAKPYRCPGCDQVIPQATPHVVAWPADDPDGLEHRRHWHTPCWTARLNRGPRTMRSGPRY
jgi:hypothetical protein